MDNHFKLGVLGGMGPRAALHFLEVLLDETKVTIDRDHVHVILDNDVTIPSRTRHLLYEEPSPVPQMWRVCQRLAGYPVDAIAIPCNSASYLFHNRVPESHDLQMPVPVLDIVNATVDQFSDSSRMTGIGSALILGGYVTSRRKAYSEPFSSLGITAVHPSEGLQQRVEDLISTIKEIGFRYYPIDQLTEIVQACRREADFDAVVLACTELDVTDTERLAGLPVISSTRALAREVLRVAAVKPSTIGGR